MDIFVVCNFWLLKYTECCKKKKGLLIDGPQEKGVLKYTSKRSVGEARKRIPPANCFLKLVYEINITIEVAGSKIYCM